MKAFPFIFILLLFGCGNSGMEPLPTEWYILVDSNGESKVVENTWGLDHVKLTYEGNQLKQVLVAYGGGADVFDINSQQMVEGTYNFYPESGDGLGFYWINQEEGIAQLFTPVESLKIIEKSKSESYIIPLSEEEPAIEQEDKKEEVAENSMDTDNKTLMLFSMLPSSVFDATTDGISDKELRKLVTNGESNDWVLSLIAEESILHVTHTISNSKVTFTHYWYQGSENLCVVLTSNESNTSFSFWEYSEGQLIPTDMGDRFPEIFNEDFSNADFETEIPYSWSLEYDGIEDYMLVATPNVFGMPEFDGVELNRLELNWNGNEFEKRTIVLN